MDFELGDSVVVTVCGDARKFDALVKGFVTYVMHYKLGVNQLHDESRYKIHSTQNMTYEGYGFLSTRMVLTEKHLPEL